ncbi:MAG: carbamoyltransferase HypF [Selenomonadaceae bacterium]|nr:carbamoyltransferase HypF [Selenomonadaceae bacterium]
MTFNIKIFGIVQGVGFRPFINRTADAFSVRGTVANKGSYVEIFAQCDLETLEKFLDAVKKNSPPRSTILKIDVTEIDEKNFTSFEIIDSTHEVGDIFVSPDISICENCKQELFDKTNRRYLHPFINCTACGPRLTILEHMPYDRERTSMKNFQMCENCAEEYNSSESRRFDAQPICCNDCGPMVYLLNSAEKNLDAINTARKILVDGGIVAIKGIGGFHLACDAKNFDAVKRLRENKFRPTKPFAVMFKDINSVERECNLTSAQKKFLDSPQKPIVLLKKKSATNIASNVAPDINRLGVMLPYTPLHLLIFDLPDDITNFPDALVMTSGNPSGSPISIDDEDAQESFGEFCDAIISHDRKILLRADDSVMDFIDDEPSMIRRSRGYAPLPIYFDLFPNPSSLFPKLAIGGELKNTFCLTKNNLMYASPYIGDIGNLKSVDVLKNSVCRMCDLLEITPEVVICDKHPRYQSSKVAAQIAKIFDVPLVKVQHHYAHILSCLAENNFHDEVIGVSFDGIGYGDDGTIWGGEFFICDTKNYQRVGHISKFTQAGGDKSARECWRSAISMMKNFDVDEVNLKLNLTTPENLAGQKFLLKNNLNCIESTSCGRLFDAVASILGICNVATYEGEAAMKLQSCAEKSGQWSVVSGQKNFSLITEKLFEEILTRRLEGYEVGALARFFHEGLAEIIASTCEEIKNSYNIKTVALSGGVFQNSLLTSLTVVKLNLHGFKVLLNKMIPPNDGGICIGQAAFTF